MRETLLRGLKLLAIVPVMAALVLAPLPALAQEAPPEPDPSLSDEITHTPDPADDQTMDEEPESTGPDSADPDAASAPSPGGAIAGRYIPPDGRALDDRIRASAAAAQGLQGPLDGGWTVRTADGRPLYGLQFSDPVGGSLEGAWRDLRRPGAANARGVVGGLFRTGGELMIRFFPVEGGDPVVLQLTGYSDDVWGGSIWESSGPETAVSVTRNEPRPVVDYASGNYSTRPAGEWARPRPARVTSSAEPSGRTAKGKKSKAAAKGKAGKGAKASSRKGKSAKASGKAASGKAKGGRSSAAPKKKKKR